MKKRENDKKRKHFMICMKCFFSNLLETVFLVSEKKNGTISGRMEFYIK